MIKYMNLTHFLLKKKRTAADVSVIPVSLQLKRAKHNYKEIICCHHRLTVLCFSKLFDGFLRFLSVDFSLKLFHLPAQSCITSLASLCLLQFLFDGRQKSGGDEPLIS